MPEVGGTADVLRVAAVSGIRWKLASAAAELRGPPGGGIVTPGPDSGVTFIAESVAVFVAIAAEANISRFGGAIDDRGSRGLTGRPTRAMGSHGCLFIRCREIFAPENHFLQMSQYLDLHFILVASIDSKDMDETMIATYAYLYTFIHTHTKNTIYV